MKQHIIVAPEERGKETIQCRIPAWVWRQTKAKAAMRVPHAYPGDLVAEALIAHLDLKDESTREKRRAS